MVDCVIVLEYIILLRVIIVFGVFIWFDVNFNVWFTYVMLWVLYVLNVERN